ncbi:hypothetical protein FQZ97_584300 [compost metagenome]
MRIEKFSVIPVIQVIYEDDEGSSYYDVHPEQDQHLLEAHACDHGTPPGCGLAVVDHEEPLAILYPSDDANSPWKGWESIGSFAGRYWQVLAHFSDGTEWSLATGNCKPSMETLCLQLNEPLQTLRMIQGLLSGAEWDSDTCADAAIILGTHGYLVKDLGDDV